MPHVRIITPENVELCDSVAINFYTTIVAFDRITIGNDALIGPYVLVHSGDHRFDDTEVPIQKQSHETAPIHIGDDVWIEGAHAVILRGIDIGREAVIAAGALVNRDVEPYAIVAGIPARKIGDRRNREARRTPEAPNGHE